MKNRRHRQASSPNSSAQGVRADVRHPGRQGRDGETRCTTGAPSRPTSAARRTGKGVGALAANPRTLKGMRPLAVLPDNITTDHLSPSNAILMTRAPANTWKMGLPEEDFNSYATTAATTSPPCAPPSPTRAGERDGGGGWQR